MILRTGPTMTTEEGRIPTMQPHSIQPFITVTTAVSRKLNMYFISLIAHTYTLIELTSVGLQLQGQWNKQCKLMHILVNRQNSLL